VGARLASVDGSLDRTYERYARSPRKQRAWAATNRGNIAIRGELLEVFLAAVGDRLAGGRFLDVGCGGGWLLTELASRGVKAERLHGVELLEGRIGSARRALPEADLRCADARRLPYEGGSFEVVAMFTVLSSLPDASSVARALREARRVLTPGGLVLVYEPRVANPFNRATRWIRAADYSEALGAGWTAKPLTVMPQIARNLGPLTARLYPVLRHVRPLLTHRLVSASR
jgi:SAM-dependent methyltransferase